MTINSMKKTASAIGASATLLATNVVVAATPVSGTQFGFLGPGAVEQTVNRILNLVLGFGALFAVVYIIWAGFDYITSSGDPEKAQKARQKIINAVIGLIIIALAFAIKDYSFELLLQRSSPSVTF